MAVITAPPRRDRFFDKDGQPTLRFYKWMESLTTTTNTVREEVTEVIESHGGAASSAEVHEISTDNAQIEDLIPAFQGGKTFESDVVRFNRVVVDSEFVDMRLGVTVTFDPNAQHNAQIITANGDGSTVRIISAIELRYKGERDFSMNIRNEGTTLHWYKFVSGTEQFWRPA